MQKPKILIIDDEEDIVFTIQEICHFAGYDSVTASNGQEGYELYKQVKPDLVIVDFHMPGWDGLTTVKKLKALDEAVGILVLTVDERQEVSDRFIEVGATDFAIKPIKAPDLIARINVNLKISQIQRETQRAKENIFVEKGISAATLSLIVNFMNNQESEVTIEEISAGVSLAYQTVHRYVQHLLDMGKIDVLPIYGQLGRPKNKYKVIDMLKK
ncbi:MAG TPA: response regulator [Clostridiales bacterium UBA8960]|nr:response regulator [Clostridiales bacterium UBA8960]